MLPYTLIAFLLFVTLFLFLYFYRGISDYIHAIKKLRKLPSPEGRLPFLGHILQIIRLPPEDMFKLFRKWNSQYPVSHVQVGFVNYINLSAPEEIEEVLSTTKHNTKGSIYSYLHRWLGDGLLTSAGGKWQVRRKILTPAFHFSILQEFIKIFNKGTEDLVKYLEKNGLNKSFPLDDLAESFTLQSITETSMGIELNDETGDGGKYKNALRKIAVLIFRRMYRPWNAFNNLYYTFSAKGLLEKQFIGDMHWFTDKIIKQRQKNFQTFVVPSENDNIVFTGKKKMAMLDILLNAKFKTGIIDDRGIRDEVNTFVFEGLDTTARLFVYILMVLGCYNDLQEQMYQEILGVMGDDKTKQPTHKDLQELCFMERCIKETLRLFPSVPMITRYLSEDINTKYGVLPKGAEVLIHIYDVNRNPNNWTDPEKFDPDRFLPENSRGRHPFAYIPFSAGPRNCIGQKFAILEVKSALVGILRKFKVEPVDTPKDIVFLQDLLLRTKNNVSVKFALR